MSIAALRVHRGVSAALLALVLVLLATVSVARADTIYPNNKLTGTTFDNGSADGFTGRRQLHAAADLLPIALAGVVCEVTNRRPTDGAATRPPPGSIESRFDTAARRSHCIPPLALVQGRATFRSPSFTVDRLGAGHASFDRRAMLDSVIALGGSGRSTSSCSISEAVERRDAADPLSRSRRNALARSAGHRLGGRRHDDHTGRRRTRYQLEIRTTFQTTRRARGAEQDDPALRQHRVCASPTAPRRSSRLRRWSRCRRTNILATSATLNGTIERPGPADDLLLPLRHDREPPGRGHGRAPGRSTAASGPTTEPRPRDVARPDEVHAVLLPDRGDEHGRSAERGRRRQHPELHDGLRADGDDARAVREPRTTAGLNSAINPNGSTTHVLL